MAFGWSLLAIASMNVAFTWSPARGSVVLYLFALLQLSKQPKWRLAFYPGLAAGFGVAAFQLTFFSRIFSVGAVALWLIFAFWVGLFAMMSRLCFRHFGVRWGLICAPFIWMGLEYFRSELYFLRFSWITPGFVFAAPIWAPGLNSLGIYGLSFILMAIASAASFCRRRAITAGVLIVAMAAISLLSQVSPLEAPASSRMVRIAGVQMEFPTEDEVLIRLREVVRQYPATELIVLSEYTFDGPVPNHVREWCAKNKLYLIAGGKAVAPGDKFYNTAFVVGPHGQVVFQQAKKIPIQFMKDGQPAPDQRLWNSPWGKVGICVCYDLSYTRVTDVLVKKGAELLIVPTMDVIDWGEAQHRLHARVAPVRAAEYGLPVFRLASSGISQYVNSSGQVVQSAPCPGEGAIVAETVGLDKPGRLPLDRWLGPVSVCMTAILVMFFTFQRLRSSALLNYLKRCSRT